ncbi:hypothetical protein Pelo_9233 [Pelomyxa schiedti]|nr:hypothetical protein Pelo_9233 [Pelomyxa schiedti]
MIGRQVGQLIMAIHRNQRVQANRPQPTDPPYKPLSKNSNSLVMVMDLSTIATLLEPAIRISFNPAICVMLGGLHSGYVDELETAVDQTNITGPQEHTWICTICRSSSLFRKAMCSLRRRFSEKNWKNNQCLVVFLGFIVQSYGQREELSRFSAALSIAGDIVQWIKTFFDWCHEFPAEVRSLTWDHTMGSTKVVFHSNPKGESLVTCSWPIGPSRTLCQEFSFSRSYSLWTDPHRYSLRVMRTDKRDRTHK